MKRHEYRCACCEEIKLIKNQVKVFWSSKSTDLVTICKNCKTKMGKAKYLDAYLRSAQIRKHLNEEEISMLISDMSNEEVDQILTKLKKYGTF